MKIIPYTERWNEGERDWSFVKDPSAEIDAWDKREGLRLPDPYRRFMLVSFRTMRAAPSSGG